MSPLSSLIERAFLRNSEVLALRVAAVEEIAPRMRRIRFAGQGLERFATDENIHARLVLPPAGLGGADWAGCDPSGRLDLRGVRPEYRKYTIRQADPAAGSLDIDFVIHEASGPGSDFARRAAPGDLVGIIGPGGRGIAPAQWYLIAGDETALPAIARIAGIVAGSARGAVVVEVDGPADEITLPLPPGMSLTWLHRNGRSAGATTLLADAVAAIRWPEETVDAFAWVAAEAEAARQIRHQLKTGRKLDKTRQMVVPYWTKD